MFQLREVLEKTLTYSILHSSVIDGINRFAIKFTSYFKEIANKGYDPLDHRKPYFDPDFEEFKRKVTETEEELRVFFDNIVSSVPNIEESLRLVLR